MSRAGADDEARVIFVLDRRTGQPLFLVEEPAVPASEAEGKLLSQAQPFADVLVATINHTTLPELWTLGDALPFGSIPRRLFKVGSCGARPQRQQLGRCGGRSPHRHL
ncbi:hypothetical protein P6U16_23850 (plasmid) [Rhizobium sp. 32-5/1]|uniref:hypothetical protein n=1 Tax=Rhizobium sp. 32-5/1 TaxID=3019602 RepID=UPI00240E5D82|nr:hypothetical protein [Rhizobium sp. 32-5/1]WEZ85984.1 hypothetical protein P6U16_23850 [Rhizobium sp. 32-5/1]